MLRPNRVGAVPRMVRGGWRSRFAELGIDAVDLGFEFKFARPFGQRRVWPAMSASWSRFQRAVSRCGLCVVEAVPLGGLGFGRVFSRSFLPLADR